jgi:hypothetical protein
MRQQGLIPMATMMERPMQSDGGSLAA